MSKKRLSAVILFIAALALTPRALLFLYVGHDEPRRFETYDTQGYVQPALNLLHHGVFSNKTEPPYDPYLLRTPAYPSLITALYWVFGESPVAVILSQLLLGTGSVLLTLLLARELGFGLRASGIAAAFVALDPVSTLLGNRLLSETLFTFLLLVFLVLLARHWNSGGWVSVVAASTFLAAAILTRPILQYFVLLVPLLFLWLSTEAKRTRVLVAGALFFLVSAALTGAWAYRNYRAAGLFTVSTISDSALFDYRAKLVLARAEGLTSEEAWGRLRQQLAEGIRHDPDDEATRRRLLRQLALDVFRRYPADTAAVVARGFVHILVDPGFSITCTLLDLESLSWDCLPGEATMFQPNVAERALQGFLDMSRLQQGVLVWSCLLLGGLYLGAALGSLRLARERRWRALAFCLLVAAYLVGVTAGGQVNYRFRAPVLPLLAILAGCGYAAGVGRLRAPERWSGS